jgi:hypothetical protein
MFAIPSDADLGVPIVVRILVERLLQCLANHQIGNSQPSRTRARIIVATVSSPQGSHCRDRRRFRYLRLITTHHINPLLRNACPHKRRGFLLRNKSFSNEGSIVCHFEMSRANSSVRAVAAA